MNEKNSTNHTNGSPQTGTDKLKPSQFDIPEMIPRPPRGVGFRRRFLLSLMLGSVFLMILFFLLQEKTQTHLGSTSSSHSDPSLPQTNNASVSTYIDALTRQPAKPLLVSTVGSSKSSHLGTATSSSSKGSLTTRDHVTKDKVASSYLNGLSQAEFNVAAHAPILVYHREVSNSSAVLSKNSNQPNQHSMQAHGMRHSLGYLHQSQAIAFLHMTQHVGSTALNSQLQTPRREDTLYAGSLIPATLLTGINSELPGTIMAKVREDVFDSVSGNALLIPQGSTLIGIYDASIAYGQSRVLVVWSRLIFPNGESLSLRGQPGVDLLGLVGLHDKVDHHYVRLFGSALLLSLFGAAGQLSQPHTASNQVSTQQILYAAIGQQLSQTAAQLMSKNMAIQPTINIGPGDKFNVLLTRDVVFPGPYQFMPATDPRGSYAK